MIPRTAVSKDYYRTVIPLKEQKVINTANIKTNSKLDLAEYENGLINIATQQFDTESHVLQLNQYIPEKLIDELVAKVEAPVLTNIIEQDYFGKQNSNELSLSGVMIGLAMSSSVSNEEAMSKGTEVAKQLIEAINKNDKYNKSPITFAIFKQESTSSLKMVRILLVLLFKRMIRTLEIGVRSMKSRIHILLMNLHKHMEKIIQK